MLLTQCGRVSLGNMVDPKYTVGASVLNPSSASLPDIKELQRPSRAVASQFSEPLEMTALSKLQPFSSSRNSPTRNAISIVLLASWKRRQRLARS